MHTYQVFLTCRTGNTPELAFMDIQIATMKDAEAIVSAISQDSRFQGCALGAITADGLPLDQRLKRAAEVAQAERRAKSTLRVGGNNWNTDLYGKRIHALRKTVRDMLAALDKVGGQTGRASTAKAPASVATEDIKICRTHTPAVQSAMAAFERLKTEKPDLYPGDDGVPGDDAAQWMLDNCYEHNIEVKSLKRYLREGRKNTQPTPSDAPREPRSAHPRGLSADARNNPR